MFKHLLVPLDGSALAEAVLPAARYLAQTLPARVTLLHVIEESAPEEVHGEPHITQPDEAERYLAGVARSFPAEVAVVQHVHRAAERDIGQALVAHVEELAAQMPVRYEVRRVGNSAKVTQVSE